MSKDVLLIIGADGQLGTAVQDVFFDSEYQLVPLEQSECDVTNPAQIEEVLDRYHPRIVINCSAYNNVEAASEEVEKAFSVNALGPYWLAKKAKKLGSVLVHVSTDYVFDGKIGTYTEVDQPHPLNVYGLSKLTGESLVLMADPAHCVIRTSWLFGSSIGGSRNFVTTMLSCAKERREVRVVNDQIGCPTYAPDLARVIRELLFHGVSGGVYHVTNAGFCTRFDFAKKLFELAGVDVILTPIRTEESETRIQRPTSTILESVRLKGTGVSIPRHWSDALGEYIKKMNP